MTIQHQSWIPGCFRHAAKGVVAQFHSILLEKSSAASQQGVGPRLQCCTEFALCIPHSSELPFWTERYLLHNFLFGKSNCNKPQVFCGKKCAETSPKIWKNPSGSHRNAKTEYRLIWFDYRGTPPEGLNFGTSFFFFETYAHQIGSIFPQAVTTKNLWNHRAIFSDCHLTMAFTSLGSRWTQSKMEGFLLVDDKPLPIPNTQTLIPMHGVFTYTKPLNYPKWN